MDPWRFDTLVKILSATGTRRALVLLLSVLPLAGTVAVRLGDEQTQADGSGRLPAAETFVTTGVPTVTTSGAAASTSTGTRARPWPLAVPRPFEVSAVCTVNTGGCCNVIHQPSPLVAPSAAACSATRWNGGAIA